ncbi:hypothetical protein SAMN04488034_10595 [Salinimicrobium catena]|uniref:Uncharacterized protein n=1 Tax=Salinimicrobium catena TaxID=390640 RepID=A0A1H5NT24_9FLAO|nr:hypothetical protein [Salinimicrobium catena]SDL54162.1 hypothetical protein SAMN04488140_10566 [Salinimicrobium catena]SEF04001.1 hypothetical protein SAMN04488034_10595 [Salinimicrobium catena]
MKLEDPSNPEKSDPPFPTEENAASSGDKNKKSFLEGLKKVGFSVWIAVMVIGGILAFLTSLLLL